MDAFEWYSVGQIADKFGVAPVLISTLFARRKLDPKRCQMVSGCRLVPASYLTEVEKVLREQGKLPVAIDEQSQARP